jgi:hypothetical protein
VVAATTEIAPSAISELATALLIERSMVLSCDQRTRGLTTLSAEITRVYRHRAMLAAVSDGETEELLEQQQQRAEREEKLAEQAEVESEEAEHRRRAEKARYLESKLEERAPADRDDETA